MKTAKDFLENVTPEEVGLSSNRLNRIDNMINSAIEKKIIPGGVAMVCKNGKIAYHKSFGFANKQSGRLYMIDDIFRIASHTKAIVAVALMILWEEGLFDLEDNISKYIPEFSNHTVIDDFDWSDLTYTTRLAQGSITIRQLLTHTSGIPVGTLTTDERIKNIYGRAGIVDIGTLERITIEENVKRMAKLPLAFNPGESCTISLGLDIIGYLVEVLSGLKLDKFLYERIFKPLGMLDTAFYLTEEKAPRLVDVQVLSGEKWILHNNNSEMDYPIAGAKVFFGGGGGLSSTTFDNAIFLQMLLNGGIYNDIQILSRTTIDFMLKNQIGDLFDFYKGLGFGFAILNEKGVLKGGSGSEGTFSWVGIYNTLQFADPKEGISGIFFKQTFGVQNDFTHDVFKRLVFQSIM